MMQQKLRDETYIRTAPPKPKNQYRHMQGTHDRIRLLILQDLELIKLGLIDDPEITYCKNSYQNSKSITRQQTALPPDELNSLKRIE